MRPQWYCRLTPQRRARPGVAALGVEVAAVVLLADAAEEVVRVGEQLVVTDVAAMMLRAEAAETAAA